jgi:Fic family protein
MANLDTTTRSVAHVWHPVEPLSDADRAIDLADVRPLYQAWRAAKEQIKQANGEGLRQFTDRLVRSLSIETGIIERIYDLDRGTTEALVTHGFVQDLVARNSTNIEPSALIEILRDQEAAIRLVMDCVASSRPLTKGFLHELHATITRHQPTTDAVDQFGNHVQIPLRRGAFKEFPNNPVREDGALHEYAPPLHVNSEIEKLLAWFSEYLEAEDPIIVTAWFHHRFAQIHPYQDGNGRVARALSTLVLLKADLLPVVVDRDSRSDYIRALEAADRGTLSPLVVQFATLEKRAILQALSVDTQRPVEKSRSISHEVIASLKAKLERRQADKDQQLRQVNSVARALRDHAATVIEAGMATLAQTLSVVDDDARGFVHLGGPDKYNEHWYKFDVIQSAKSSGKWVNFEEDHYFVKATIRVENVRLVFVASLHHIGRELSGVMEGTAFAQLESFESGAADHASAKHYAVCSLEPFVMAWNTNVAEVKPLFDQWLDSALAVAFKEFADRI